MLLLVTGSLCPWLTLLVLLQGHNSVGLLCVAVFGPGAHDADIVFLASSGLAVGAGKGF